MPWSSKFGQEMGGEVRRRRHPAPGRRLDRRNGRALASITSFPRRWSSTTERPPARGSAPRLAPRFAIASPRPPRFPALRMPKLFLKSAGCYLSCWLRSFLPGAMRPPTEWAAASSSCFCSIFLPLPCLQLLHALAGSRRSPLPAYRRVELRAPVFVTGLPRSGTTFVHRTSRRTRGFAPSPPGRPCSRPRAGAPLLPRGGRIDRRLGGPLRRTVDPVLKQFGGDFDSVHAVRRDAPKDYLALLPFSGCFPSSSPSLCRGFPRWGASTKSRRQPGSPCSRPPPPPHTNVACRNSSFARLAWQALALQERAFGNWVPDLCPAPLSGRRASCSASGTRWTASDSQPAPWPEGADFFGTDPTTRAFARLFNLNLRPQLTPASADFTARAPGRPLRDPRPRPAAKGPPATTRARAGGQRPSSPTGPSAPASIPSNQPSRARTPRSRRISLGPESKSKFGISPRLPEDARTQPPTRSRMRPPPPDTLPGIRTARHRLPRRASRPLPTSAWPSSPIRPPSETPRAPILTTSPPSSPPGSRGGRCSSPCRIHRPPWLSFPMPGDPMQRSVTPNLLRHRARLQAPARSVIAVTPIPSASSGLYHAWRRRRPLPSPPTITDLRGNLARIYWKRASPGDRQRLPLRGTIRNPLPAGGEAVLINNSQPGATWKKKLGAGAAWRSWARRSSPTSFCRPMRPPPARAVTAQSVSPDGSRRRRTSTRIIDRPRAPQCLYLVQVIAGHDAPAGSYLRCSRLEDPSRVEEVRSRPDGCSRGRD